MLAALSWSRAPTYIWDAFLIIVVLAFMIMTHEMGHFFAAKWVGIKVDAFSLGFGPEIVGWTRGETRYSIKWIFAGGSVRIAGMNPEEEIKPEDLPRTYYEAPAWKRAIVIVAGSFVHIVIAFILFYIFFWPVGYQDLTGKVGTVAKTLEVGTSLNPAQAGVGGPAFVLTVNGTNFIPNSSVNWNGSRLSTRYVSNTVLKATVPAGEIAAAGTAKVTVVNPKPVGGTSNVQNFNIIRPPPVMTAVTPASGLIGDTVTITGTRFGSSQGSSVVIFNRAPAKPSSWTDTAIKVKVPSGGTTGPVVVATDAGLSNTDKSFTVKNVLPTLTSMSPEQVNVGAGAFVLTVRGTNFIAGSVIDWNGSKLSTTYRSNTMLTASVPAQDIAGAGTADVTVFNPGSVGGSSNPLIFNIIKPGPAIASVSPAGGLMGDTVTITGTRFGSSQGSSVVGFNNTQAKPSSWKDNSIVVKVPVGATTGPVVVSTSSGLSNTDMAFTVNNIVPQHISLNPQQATTGGPAFVLTVSGTDFIRGAVVDLDGVSLATTYVSSSVLRAEVPADALAAAGTSKVKVVNPPPTGGTSSTRSFKVTDPLPVITAVSPTSGLTGSTVTLTGSHFISTQGKSTVTFNKAAATPSVLKDNKIVVKVPSNGTTGPVVVTTQAGASNTDTVFTVTNANPRPVTSSSAIRPGPAFVADMQAGDLITSVNGTGVIDWVQLSAQLSKRPGQKVVLIFDRGPGVLRTTATLLNVDGSGKLGIIVDQNSTFEKKSNPIVAVGQSAKTMVVVTGGLAKGIAGLFSYTTLKQLVGAAPRTQNSPRSIVGAAQLTFQAAGQGASVVIFIIAQLFLFLALFNLIPLPPLDGGHLLVIVVKKVFNKDINMQTFAKVAVVVIVVLSILALRLALLDIFNPLKNPFKP